jgi:hypothetical protein
MIIELEMLQEKIAQVPGFPTELKILLEHLIISHHGEYEFGSPKLPMFPEALMLHYLDDLDSKMESMRAQFEREAELDTPWTSYNASLARPLLNTRKFLQKGLEGSRLVEVSKATAAAAASSASQHLTTEDHAGEDAGQGERSSEQPQASAESAPEEKPVASAFEALQRKFESHKVTPATEKAH